MLIVIRKMAYVWGYPIGMTVMTLMTVNCTDILKWGTSLLRRLSYPFNLPDEPDAQSKESRTYAIFEAPAASGLSNPLHNPTPLPDDEPPLSSGW